MLQFLDEEFLKTLNATFLGNPLWRYLMALAASFIAFTVLGVLRRQFTRIARVRNNLFWLTLVRVRTLTIFVISTYIGFALLDFAPKVEEVGRMISTTLVAIQVMVIAGNSISVILAQSLLRNSRDNPSVKNAARNLGAILTVVLWTLGILFILSNMGFNVGSLIAGLGIGGIAIALATQSVLGDTFSCFVIYFDRPFEVGETIQFDGITGTVEEIGLRTTRVRSVNGELIVVGNSDLTRARIVKPQDIHRRRAVVKWGIEYGVPTQRLKEIPSLVQAIVEQTPNTRFDHCHLVELGSYSLNFELVYFVDSGEGKLYQDRVQQIHLALLECFERLKVGLAFPTQNIQLNQHSK